MKKAFFVTVLATALGSMYALADLSDGNVSVSEERLLGFFKEVGGQVPGLKFDRVKIDSVKPVPGEQGWMAVFMTIEVEAKGRKLQAADALFINGDLATPSLYNMKTGKNYKVEMKIAPLYRKDHLIAGAPDARHKVVIFSDPLCPFCKETVPGYIKAAKDHPNDIALYYYHAPLTRIHPASSILVEAVEAAKIKGEKNAEALIYDAGIDPGNTDVKSIVKTINDKFGWKLKPEDLESDEVKKRLGVDASAVKMLGIHSTPSIFIDGKASEQRDPAALTQKEGAK
jgi:thiol:disulfide interchange protein DsbC